MFTTSTLATRTISRYAGIFAIGALSLGCQDKTIKSSVPIYDLTQVELSPVRPGYYINYLNGPETDNLFGVSEVRSGGKSIGYTFTPGNYFEPGNLLIDSKYNVLGIKVPVTYYFDGKGTNNNLSIDESHKDIIFSLSGLTVRPEAKELPEGKYLPIFDQLSIRAIPPMEKLLRDEDIPEWHDCDHAEGNCYPDLSKYEYGGYYLNNRIFIEEFKYGRIIGFMKQ